MNEPSDLYRQLSQGIMFKNVPVVPVVGIGYMLLATLAAGAASPAAGLSVFVLGLLAIAIVYLAVMRQEGGPLVPSQRGQEASGSQRKDESPSQRGQEASGSQQRKDDESPSQRGDTDAKRDDPAG